MADCRPSSISVGPSCSPRRKVRSDRKNGLISVYVTILLMVGNLSLVFPSAELAKLKMQLVLPGQTGTLTSAADRKLEEGQRVRNNFIPTLHCFKGSSPFILRKTCLDLFCFGFFQQNLRQLRLDLQKLGADLQSGERACCRNTGGERLRQALTAADETIAKQVHPYRYT